MKHILTMFAVLFCLSASGQSDTAKMRGYYLIVTDSVYEKMKGRSVKGEPYSDFKMSDGRIICAAWLRDIFPEITGIPITLNVEDIK